MDQHALLIYTLMRLAHVDSPEDARRREQLLRLEREALEARRRRRHNRLRRVWSALTAPRSTQREQETRRAEAPDLRQALR
jgi:hypothetical protein